MNWDSAIALLGSGAGVVASAVAVMTYRRQFSDRPAEPDRRFEAERTMVIAGRPTYRPDYPPWPAPPPIRSAPRSRATAGQKSARLTLLLFLLGLAGTAAAVVISRPKGNTTVSLPLAALSDIVVIVASIRLIVLLQRQWKASGLNR